MKVCHDLWVVVPWTFMEPTERAEVIRIATQAGIPEDLFADWDGGELALYRDRSAGSASLAVAQRQLQEKAARGDWILDLGNRAVALPRNQGESLKHEFDRLGIAYDRLSQTNAYLKRTRWAVDQHHEVLDELAKR
jgi:hypothetical protein